MQCLLFAALALFLIAPDRLRPVLAGRRLDVVFQVGDLVESTGTPEEIRAAFQKAAAILDRLPVPWHLTGPCISLTGLWNDDTME